LYIHELRLDRVKKSASRLDFDVYEIDINHFIFGIDFIIEC